MNFSKGVEKMDDLEFDVKCWNNHMGFWLIEQKFFKGIVDALRGGYFKKPDTSKPFFSQIAVSSNQQRKPYFLTSSGVAIIPLYGPMSKNGSAKFGEANTTKIRALVREAARDGDVKAILLEVDSPGGSVSGVQELAKDVFNARQNKKVYAQISDCGASAAYWVASQAHKVYANQNAFVGSIGTIMVLEDNSKKLDLEGVAVHVITTGKYKAAGLSGVGIDEESLQYFSKFAEQLTESFVESIKPVRPKLNLEEVLSGKCYLGNEAKSLGLIDKVQTFDETLFEIEQTLLPKQNNRIKAQNDLRLADCELDLI